MFPRCFCRVVFPPRKIIRLMQPDNVTSWCHTGEPLFISPSCPAAFWACSFAVAMASHPALHLGQQVTQVDGRTGALSVVFVCAIRHDGFVQTGLSCSASSCYGPTPCQLRSPSMSVICSYLPGVFWQWLFHLEALRLTMIRFNRRLFPLPAARLSSGKNAETLTSWVHPSKFSPAARLASRYVRHRRGHSTEGFGHIGI